MLHHLIIIGNWLVLPEYPKFVCIWSRYQVHVHNESCYTD